MLTHGPAQSEIQVPSPQKQANEGAELWAYTAELFAPTLSQEPSSQFMKTILEKLLMRDQRKNQPSAGPAKMPHGQGDPNKSPLAISPDTRVSQHAEGLTLLHIPSGKIFVCNRTAARIWQGATEGRCLDELSEEMSRQFRIEREVAQKDTYSVVSQMELHGLIVRSGL